MTPFIYDWMTEFNPFMLDLAGESTLIRQKVRVFMNGIYKNDNFGRDIDVILVWTQFQ